MGLTSESIIVWTSKTKSLLASLCKREVIPLFGYLFPAAQAGKEGVGEIFKSDVFTILD